MSVIKQTNTVAARLGAAAVGTAASFTLFAAYMVIPPAGFFLSLLAPLPAVFSRFGYGRSTTLIITLLTTTLMTAVFGIQAGALYLLQCAVIALLLPEFLAKGFNASRAIAWTTAANLLLIASMALAYAITSGQNIHTQVVNEINTSITQAIGIYQKAGVKGDELDLLKQSMTRAAELVVKIYPALTTLFLIAISSCNLALVKRFSVKLGADLRVGEFREFKNPELLIWLLIIAGFAMMAGNPIITIPALNVVIIVAALYFLQGLAVVITIINRQTLARILRMMLFFMLLIQPYLAALIAAMGIFDLWGDFRTPRNKENL